MLPVKFSGSHCNSPIICWIWWGFPLWWIPWKIFHSKFTLSINSIQFAENNCCPNTLKFASSKIQQECLRLFPKQSTESEKQRQWQRILINSFVQQILIPTSNLGNWPRCPKDILDAIELDAVEELVTIEKIDSSLHPHFFFVILYALRHCWAVHKTDILCATNGAEIVDVEWMKIDCSTHHVWKSLLWTWLASWCLVSMWRNLNLGSKLILSNNQPRTTLWVRETCLVVGPSTLENQFGHCLTVLKNMQHNALYFVINVCWDDVGVLDGDGVMHDNGSTVRCAMKHFQLLVRKGQEREYRPCADLHREKWFHLLWNCVKLKSLSGTSNFLVQMCDFRVDFESSRSPAKSESWNNGSVVVRYFPHDNVSDVHLYDDTRQTFVGLCPLCDRTRKFYHRP